jgi:hypothetical protein
MGMIEIIKLKGADIYEVLEVSKCVEYWELDDEELNWVNLQCPSSRVISDSDIQSD